MKIKERRVGRPMHFLLTFRIFLLCPLRLLLLLYPPFLLPCIGRLTPSPPCPPMAPGSPPSWPWVWATSDWLMRQEAAPTISASSTPGAGKGRGRSHGREGGLLGDEFFFQFIYSLLLWLGKKGSSMGVRSGFINSKQDSKTLKDLTDFAIWLINWYL